MHRPIVFFQRFQAFFSMPSLAWMALFFLTPTFILFLISFRAPDAFGGISEYWTLETWMNLANKNYLSIAWRTFLLSAMTAILCIALAIPTAYTIVQSKPKARQWLLLLVILPFWVNFLIRIFAWKILLHPDGFFKQMLVWMHVIDSSAILLYGPGAVLLIMVYCYLPYAILPIYAACEKFDYALLEAASDLGASRLQAFWKVFLPGIKRGIFSALVMVFVPAMGAYVIPDMVGGTRAEMISSKISQHVFIDRNLPQASALSALLTLGVLLPFLYFQIRSRSKKVSE